MSESSSAIHVYRNNMWYENQNCSDTFRMCTWTTLAEHMWQRLRAHSTRLPRPIGLHLYRIHEEKKTSTSYLAKNCFFFFFFLKRNRRTREVMRGDGCDAEAAMPHCRDVEGIRRSEGCLRLKLGSPEFLHCTINRRISVNKHKIAGDRSKR